MVNISGQLIVAVGEFAGVPFTTEAFCHEEAAQGGFVRQSLPTGDGGRCKCKGAQIQIPGLIQLFNPLFSAVRKRAHAALGAPVGEEEGLAHLALVLDHDFLLQSQLILPMQKPLCQIRKHEAATPWMGSCPPRGLSSTGLAPTSASSAPKVQLCM